MHDWWSVMIAWESMTSLFQKETIFVTRNFCVWSPRKFLLNPQAPEMNNLLLPFSKKCWDAGKYMEVDIGIPFWYESYILWIRKPSTKKPIKHIEICNGLECMYIHICDSMCTCHTYIIYFTTSKGSPWSWWSTSTSRTSLGLSHHISRSSLAIREFQLPLYLGKTRGKEWKQDNKNTAGNSTVAGGKLFWLRLLEKKSGAQEMGD